MKTEWHWAENAPDATATQAAPTTPPSPIFPQPVVPPACFVTCPLWPEEQTGLRKKHVLHFLVVFNPIGLPIWATTQAVVLVEVAEKHEVAGQSL